jgi:hypothetical protein
VAARATPGRGNNNDDSKADNHDNDNRRGGGDGRNTAESTTLLSPETKGRVLRRPARWVRCTHPARRDRS